MLVAVDKPPGVSTQAPPGGDSLERRLREQLGARADYLAFPHRLDVPVSGVVLAALKKRAARLLGEQFAARKVEKLYLAIVHGKIDPADALWFDFLRKIPDQPKVEVADQDRTDSKRADTRVEVVRYNPDTDRTLLKMYPCTGRMHQLRVQAAVRGHPIVGDTLYGGNLEVDGSGACGSRGILLRAQSIVFHDPRNGIRTTVSASEIFGERV